MALDAAPVKRISDRGEKVLDIRPMVAGIVVTGPGKLRFMLQESGGKSAKPHELFQPLLGIGPSEARTIMIKRIGMQ
jgi:hypothetical protein